MLLTKLKNNLKYMLIQLTLYKMLNYKINIKTFQDLWQEQKQKIMI